MTIVRATQPGRFADSTHETTHVAPNGQEPVSHANGYFRRGGRDLPVATAAEKTVSF